MRIIVRLRGFALFATILRSILWGDIRIIDPVASRCVKFRFKPIPTDVQLNKLEEICRAEKVNLNKSDLINLLEKGDLRQSINSLQSFHSLHLVPLNLLPTPIQYCEKLINAVFTASNIKQVYQISIFLFIRRQISRVR